MQEDVRSEKPEGTVEILQKNVLSDDWGKLTKYIYKRRRSDGFVETLSREVYDRGHGAVVLLFDKSRETIVLTRQFRLPAYVTGHHSDLIEACAGLLDDRDPEVAIRKEIEEETGYEIRNIERLWHVYMSPGSVSERLHFYIGEYDSTCRRSQGGGIADEGEDIQVLELSVKEAMRMISGGIIIDAKTIMLVQHAAIVLYADGTKYI